MVPHRRTPARRPRRALSGAVLALSGAVLALLVLAAACGSSGPTGGSATDRGAGSTAGTTPVKVVATTTQVQDFTRAVGGDCVQVYGVLRPNVDPHDFEPSPADLQAFADAELIVENGVGLESWLDDTITSSGTHARVVDTSAGIEIRGGGDGDPQGDPHLWHDPRNAAAMVTTIERALAEVRPACADELAAHLAGYTAQLEQLDRDNRAAIDQLTNKKLVTNHDAFAYYVARYGLDYVGAIIPSFDTTAELSAREIADLVAAIRAQGVKAVFSESSLPRRTAETIADEAGVTVVAGEDALYGDTLGPAGSDGATYLQAEAHNTRTIVDNLR